MGIQGACSLTGERHTNTTQDNSRRTSGVGVGSTSLAGMARKGLSEGDLSIM